MDDQSQRRGPRFVYLTDNDALSAQGRFAWRLEAANHRSIGRAAATDVGLIACRAAAQRLHDLLSDVAAAVRYERVAGTWLWQASATGVGAVGARAYARRVECARAFEQFLDSAAAADPDEGVVRGYGPGSLRAFAEPSHAPSDVVAR